jgi:hypothetical protein
VIQEMAVSSNVLIICGHDVMRWERFSETLWAIVSLAPDLSGPSTESLVLFKRRLNIHMSISRSGTRSLADLVANVRIMTATDPKDMVYAILGLADNVWADQSRHPVTLPDYSPLTSVLDVYRDLVEHAIANGSLDIICMQRLYDRLEDGTWPSWVSDWSSSGVGTHSLKGNYHGFNMVERGCLINKPLIEKYNGLKELNAGLDGSWRAAGESLPIARVTKSPPVLHATGIFVDSISELGNAFEFGDFRLLLCDFSSWDELILNTLGTRSTSHEQSGTDAFTVLDECHKFCLSRGVVFQETFYKIVKVAYKFTRFWQRDRFRSKLLRNRLIGEEKYIGGDTISEAYTRTLFLDRVLTSDRTSSEGYEFMKSGRWQDIVSSGGPTDDIAEALNTVRANVLHRKLIISDRGYIGLGPIVARKSDMICILYGCSVPVIIRKVGDHYLFIGECYVQGLMDGQALELLKQGKAREVMFDLH